MSRLPITFGILFTLTITASRPVDAQQPLSASLIGIYRADGSLQCETAAGQSLADAAKELGSTGVKVQSQEKRKHPGLFRTECGTPTGHVNYFRIIASDLAKVNIDLNEENAFRVWEFDARTLMISQDVFRRVFSRDSALRAIPLAAKIPVVVKEFVNAGILPIEARSKRIQWQGAAGDVLELEFRIPADQLLAAKKLGYSEIVSRFGPACAGVIAPPEGSAEFSRLQPAEYFPLNMAPVPRTPLAEPGRTLTFTSFLSSKGTVDSVHVAGAAQATPVLGEWMADMKKWEWRPAVFDGCNVAATGKYVYRARQ